MTKKFLVGLVLLVVSVGSGGSVAAQAPVQLRDEAITDFHSEITINQDTSISIKETIAYTTTLEKHGIYRYIPIRYHRNGLNYTARVLDVKITDDQGEAIPFERSYESGNIMLKIGDPDTTFTGDKTYVLAYRVENAVSEVPELYWDITGEGWQVTIDNSRATIVSPHAGITTVTCFSGAVGSNDQLCHSKKITDEKAEFTYDQPIFYNQNLTIAVGLNPQNSLRFPTRTEKLLKQIKDNLGLLPLIIPGMIMLWWWLKRGRDWSFISWNVFTHDETQPQSVVPLWNRRPIPMVYEPLQDLTPGEAGSLIDEKIDSQDIIAEIIDLARQKFLKIERIEKKKLLILDDNDYQFTKLKAATANLPAHQQYLLEKIFASGDVVKLSELKGTFYTAIEGMKKRINESLVKKNLFRENPDTVRGKAFGGAILLLVLTGWWGVMLLEQGIWWALPIFGISTLVSLVTAYQMPSKTAKGTNLAWQARGLRQSISYGAWREKIKEKHLFFEEVLPFAIALGVVDQLTREMEKLNVKPPEYLGGTHARSWSTNSFIHSFSSQASSSLTYNPNSSSWSGGSSSGGSSGGGGGGGGGGSW